MPTTLLRVETALWKRAEWLHSSCSSAPSSADEGGGGAVGRVEAGFEDALACRAEAGGRREAGEDAFRREDPFSGGAAATSSVVAGRRRGAAAAGFEPDDLAGG